MKIYLPEITFSAAHYIPGHKGKCAGIHGHTYFIKDLTIDMGVPILDKMGISVDFGDVKQYFKDEWDHKFIIPKSHKMFLESALLTFPEELDPPKVNNLKPVEFTSAEGIAEMMQYELVDIVNPKDIGFQPVSQSDIHFKLFEGPNQAVEI